MVDAFDAEPTLRVDAPDWFRRALEVPFEQRSVEVDGCDINFLQWGAPSDEGLVFVTNYTRGSLTVADAETGEVLQELPGLEDASGVAVTPTQSPL